MANNIQKITIEIETVNASFQDGNFDYEISQMMRRIERALHYNKSDKMSIQDSNGNTCCHVKVERE